MDWQMMWNTLYSEECERGHRDPKVRARYFAWSHIMDTPRPSLGGAFWWW